MTPRRTRAQWGSLVATFERSTLSAGRFCAVRGLDAGDVPLVAVRAAQRWCRGHGGGVRPAAGRRGGRPRLAGAAPVVVAFSGVEVRADVGTDPSYLGALVAELRSRCPGRRLAVECARVPGRRARSTFGAATTVSSGNRARRWLAPQPVRRSSLRLPGSSPRSGEDPGVGPQRLRPLHYKRSVPGPVPDAKGTGRSNAGGTGRHGRWPCCSTALT